jgi:hypothetical protein
MMCAQNFWFAACCTSFSPASQFGSDLGSHVLCWSWCLAPPVNLLASATEDFHLDLSLRWHRFWWVSPCASSVQSNQISTSGLYVVFVFLHWCLESAFLGRCGALRRPTPPISVFPALCSKLKRKCRRSRSQFLAWFTSLFSAPGFYLVGTGTYMFHSSSTRSPSAPCARLFSYYSHVFSA